MRMKPVYFCLFCIVSTMSLFAQTDSENLKTDLLVAVSANDGLFSESIKSNYLDWTEAYVKEQLILSNQTVSADFWPWISENPEIKNGMLTAVCPPDQDIAKNLSDLRQELGTDTTDAYIGLFLAASVSHRDSGIAAPPAEIFTYETNVVNILEPYLATNNLTVKEAYNDWLNVKSVLDGTPYWLRNTSTDQKKFRSYLVQVGGLTGAFPPVRDPYASVAETLQFLISKRNVEVPPFYEPTDKLNLTWPLFPIETAPWQLLTTLAQNTPISESQHLWERFMGKRPLENEGDRYDISGPYRSDFRTSDYIFDVQTWAPSSAMGKMYIGGVCGTMSSIAKYTKHALGEPGISCTQPQHSNYSQYDQIPGTPFFFTRIQQAISTPPRTYAKWTFHAEDGALRVKESYKVGIEYHFGMTLGLNYGKETYENSRILFHIYNLLSEDERRITGNNLLAAATHQTPYNPEIWYKRYQLNPTPDTATQIFTALLQSIDYDPANFINVKQLPLDPTLSSVDESLIPALDRPKSEYVNTIICTILNDLFSYSGNLGKVVDFANQLAEIFERYDTMNTDWPAFLNVVETAASESAISYDFINEIIRAKCLGNKTVRAEAEKLFLDLVLEVNARENPPKDLYISAIDHIAAAFAMYYIEDPAKAIEWMEELNATFNLNARFRLSNDEVVREKFYDKFIEFYKELLTRSDATALNKQLTEQMSLFHGYETNGAFAAFSVDKTVARIDQPIQLTDQSTNSPTAWKWSIPEANIPDDTVRNPTISFPLPGFYDVALTVDNYSCVRKRNLIEVGMIWKKLFTDSFESGVGSYTLGTNSTLTKKNSIEGTSVYINKSNSDNSTLTLSEGIDLATETFTALRVDFSYRTKGYQDGHSIRIEYWSGGTWVDAGRYYAGTDFENEILQTGSFRIPIHAETTDLQKLKFRFSTKTNDKPSRKLYLDNITVYCGRTESLSPALSGLTSAVAPSSDVPVNGPVNIIIHWPSTAGETYEVHCSTNLVNRFELIESGVPATPPENTYTTRVQKACSFYRIVPEE